MSNLRVMYILYEYPQISETYVRSEIEAVQEEADVRIIALNRANLPYLNHAPFECLQDEDAIWEEIDEFRPHVLHSHWLFQSRILANFAGYFSGHSSRFSIPFTIRAHSFDILDHGGKNIRESAPLINSELCLGVLSFPFTRLFLENGGIRPEKIFDCYPVVNYHRFYDRSPNGSAIMNVGACLPKKAMEDFLTLASLVPERQFNLYALGYEAPAICRLAEKIGNPVNIVPPVQPEDMKAEYKKHEWLVYTASREINTVGWPMSAAEAQAAGVGVCLPNIRPDIREYLGAAGFVYDSISEVADLVSKPLPTEIRELGFEQAKKSDIFEHKRILFDLWRKAAADGATSRSFLRNSEDGLAEWGQGYTGLELRKRLRQALEELGRVVPSGRPYVLADQAEWDMGLADRHAVPFPEKEGRYGGLPADDETAIRELERLRQSGAQFLVVAWPAFWWLDYYPGFHRYLRSRFPCLLQNERLVVFSLQDRNVGSPAATET